MKKINLLLFLAVSLLSISFASALMPADYYSYTDVLVVRNLNSSDSITLVNTFEQYYPDVTIVNITAPASYTTDFQTWNETVRMPIEEFIVENNIIDSINYIVLTRDIPYYLTPNTGGNRIMNGDDFLMLMLGQYNTSIAECAGTFCGQIINPAYTDEITTNDYHETYDIYLVSRIDGPTLETASALILANSYQNVTALETGIWLFDSTPSPISGTLDSYIENAYNSISALSYNATFENTALFLTNQTYLIGYHSWGSNDPNASSNSSSWNLSMENGSFCSDYVSTGARNLQQYPWASGQSLTSDFINYGCSFSIGYMFEPFSNGVTYPHYSHFNYAKGYNALDSAVSGTPSLNWYTIYVGNPKNHIAELSLKVFASNFSATQIYYCNKDYCFDGATYSSEQPAGRTISTCNFITCA